MIPQEKHGGPTRKLSLSSLTHTHFLLRLKSLETIEARTNVLLGRQKLIYFARKSILLDLGFFNELEISDSGHSPPERLVFWAFTP